VSGTELAITNELVDTAVVVKVVGEIDNTYRYQFESWLGAAVELAGLPENAGVVAVDLLGVSFLGSAGLSALVRATGLAQASGKSLRIVVNDHRPVLRPIQLMGWTRCSRSVAASPMPCGWSCEVPSGASRPTRSVGFANVNHAPNKAGPPQR
jgi:anti-sigma B factor antagonist